MSDVLIQRLTKRHGEVTVLHGIDLDVPRGEFLTLLGPSGCGKSTTLFALAGLDKPSGGRIAVDGRTFYDGEDGTFVAPEERNLGLVFQSYALWPHMTVAKNLSFPLTLREVPKAEQRARIAEALELVDLGDYADRFPHELSGGQQQRVALARTLVFRPSLLLLDEPLSNLDAKLRIKSRALLKSLQRQLGLTTLYVTHDQEEALAMSDRIAVMERGRIVQIDRPEAIYNRPATRFVADFVGAGNFLPVRASRGEQGEIVEARLERGEVLRATRSTATEVDTQGFMTVRPQYLRLAPPGSPLAPGSNRLDGVIEERTFLGVRSAYVIRVGDHLVTAESEERYEIGPVTLAFRPTDTLLLDH